ncbi:hypothetical protein Landi51_10432 [Colletotrichum acutatum]
MRRPPPLPTPRHHLALTKKNANSLDPWYRCKDSANRRLANPGLRPSETQKQRSRDKAPETRLIRRIKGRTITKTTKNTKALMSPATCSFVETAMTLIRLGKGDLAT